MSETSPQGDNPSPDGWAPHDYTDGRGKGDWKTQYPPEARKAIHWETAYLCLLFAIYVAAAFYVVHLALEAKQPQGAEIVETAQRTATFLGFVAAWVGGSLGGCSFGIKWMYHCVAKHMWHEDRRLWRLLTPHLSGVVSLFMVFLISSNLLQMFDKDFAARPIGVMAFSFLVGYFSDRAVAKMAEVADTLFGAATGKK